MYQNIQILKEAAIQRIAYTEMKKRKYPMDDIEVCSDRLGELLASLSYDIQKNHPEIAKVIDYYTDVLDDVSRLVIRPENKHL